MQIFLPWFCSYNRAFVARISCLAKAKNSHRVTALKWAAQISWDIQQRGLAHKKLAANPRTPNSMLRSMCEQSAFWSWQSLLDNNVFRSNGHIMQNTPLLVRSVKLSSIEPSQYLDGWPPGNYLAVAAWSSGQDIGELFNEFGFEPGLQTFRMLIVTIFCNVIGKLMGGCASFEISQVCERAIGAGKDLQRHLGPGRGATINNSSPLPLLRG
jgi:hypothetical protein